MLCGVILLQNNRLRTTFPRRRGGRGFTAQSDVIPGAFAATILECLYPRGLNEQVEPNRGGFSLRADCPITDRMMPHWYLADRQRNTPENASPTEKLYLLNVPIRLSKNTSQTGRRPDGTAELLTPDFQWAMQALQELASYPRLRCRLYGNNVLAEFGHTENHIPGTTMVFGIALFMYEQVPPCDPQRKGINLNQLHDDLDAKASSDQITTQILLQTKEGFSVAQGTQELDESIPDAINTGAALVIVLASGSSTNPVYWRNIDYGCNLRVSRCRLQRGYNRAIFETKVGFYRKVHLEISAKQLNTVTIRKLWAQGIVHPESKTPLDTPIVTAQTLSALEALQLDKDVSEHGQGPAGAVLSQIATHSVMLNQSSALSNESSSPSHFTKDSPSNISQVRTRPIQKIYVTAWKIKKYII